MSKADEMFEELGYRKDTYYDESSFIYVDEDGRYIEFSKMLENFKSNTWLSSEELQAINEKVKELGWLDE